MNLKEVLGKSHFHSEADSNVLEKDFFHIYEIFTVKLPSY